VDKDLYELPPEEHAGIKQVPGSLSEALNALEEDHDFLSAGDVFTEDLIETWLDLKRGEVDQARLAPTPLEYELYFNI
jgi:glutamine synthetase